MTVTTLPFHAVLLRCDLGHEEATTEESWGHPQTSKRCSRCHHRLALVRTVTIWPGGRR